MSAEGQAPFFSAWSGRQGLSGFSSLTLLTRQPLGDTDTAEETIWQAWWLGGETETTAASTFLLMGVG